MQGNDMITAFESKIYRKDQTVIWISENCRAVRDAEGKVLYYEGTVEDITERNTRKKKSGGPPPNCRAAARNCGRKTK